MRVEVPASRSTDPETSRLAEEMINQAGTRFNHQQRVGRMVKLCPGKTAAELGALTALGQHEASRRLADIAGITVEKGERRRCTVKGTQMVTWWPK